MGGGICVALNELRDNGRPGALQYIILLSDGQPNRLGGPGCPSGAGVPSGAEEYALYLAQLAADSNVVIHTIGLGSEVNDELMIEIAAITGGQYFDANTADDLEAQFEEVADILGIALVQ
jgi:secreted protein with Ig-like and vWFA domain